MPTMLTLLLVAVSLTGGSAAQLPQSHLPPPLRVYVPFEGAWNAMIEVLEESRFSEYEADRARGHIVTEYLEYISGPLTEEYLKKIGNPPGLGDAYWVRGEYQLEIIVELVEERETLVTVYANVRGLKRGFLGEETMVPIPTNGTREEELMRAFGKRIFGANFELDNPRRGFWERDPEYVPDMLERIPRIAGPERP